MTDNWQPTSDAAHAATKPVTIAGIRHAAKTMAAHDGLDALIDAKNADSLKMIMNTDENTIRTLLWVAVTGVHRDYRIPAKRPTTHDNGKDFTANQMREMIADILTNSPEAIIPTIRAVADSLAPLDPENLDAA